MVLFQCVTPAEFDLPRITAQDALIFRQDAVYHLLKQQSWPTQHVYALQQDLIDRGIEMDKIPNNIRIINDLQWVDLTLQASQVILAV